MNLINKITINDDIVYHYPWLDTTKIYIYLEKNIQTDKTFKVFILSLICFKLKKMYDLKVKSEYEQDYLFILLDGFTDYSKTKKYLINMCEYFINKRLSFKKEDSDMKKYYDINYDRILTFFKELKKFIIDENIKYYYQAVDGFN